MHGVLALLLGEIAIPSAGQCLVFAAPFVAVALAWWVIERIDVIMHHLFPHREWERQLGWLNIRAERQAAAMLRWLGYGLYALLAAALYGIIWAAKAFPALENWNEIPVLDHLALRVPVLVLCLGFWLLYFGAVLLPKLRNEWEKEELDKFRVEMEAEELRKEQPVSRLKSTLLPGPKANRVAGSQRPKPKG